MASKRTTRSSTKGDAVGGGHQNGNEDGFINAKRHQPRAPRVKWTQDNDRKLLIIWGGKEISPAEHTQIATLFPENPTTKSIQERYTKLRIEQTNMLKEIKRDNHVSDVQMLPWTLEQERKLLLIWGGKEVSAKEYGQIAALFAEGSTPKMVQTKYLELRTEQLDVLCDLELSEPTARIQKLPASDSDGDEDEDDAESPPHPAKVSKGKARAATITAAPSRALARNAPAPAAGMLTRARQQRETVEQLEREAFEADHKARFEAAEALMNISTPEKRKRGKRD